MHTDKQLVFAPLLSIPAINAIRWVFVLFRKCIHGINPTPLHTPKFFLNSAANSYLRKRPVFSTNISMQTHIIARVNTTGKSAFSTPTEWPTHSWGNPLKWHMTSLQRHLSPRPLPSLPRQSRHSGALLATHSIAAPFEILLLYRDDSMRISVSAAHSDCCCRISRNSLEGTLVLWCFFFPLLFKIILASRPDFKVLMCDHKSICRQAKTLRLYLTAVPLTDESNFLIILNVP